MHHPADSAHVTHRLSTLRETHGATSFATGQTMFHGGRSVYLANPHHLACQLTTPAIATLAIQPGWQQLTLWTGMLLGLVIVTFATANALFLAYPHHPRYEGIAMMLRTKQTFINKGKVSVIARCLLGLWPTLKLSLLSKSYAPKCYVSGSITASWLAALLGLAEATLR